MRRLTVQTLIDEVRSMIDEDNTSSVDDALDILPALNRAQDYAGNILARQYESPMITHTTVGLIAGVNEYDIPEDAFEQRLEKVEVSINQLFYPVKRLDYQDITLYETPTKINVPYYYCVIGNKFRLLPTPSGTYSLRIWYLKDPDPLVKEQGRITILNTANNYLIVDSIGSDLTAEMDQLNSYVNIVDGQSGLIKASMQIQSIQGNKITFKSSPTRSTVLNKTISSSIPSTVEADDLICVLSGSCVPLFKKPNSNFLIQYAVAEITRKLGGPADIEKAVLKDLELQVERSWVGREVSQRVKKVSKNWAVPTRRYFNSM
jgi:hypothetical protein